MEHYRKASSHAAENEEKKEVYDIHVKSGSKIKNIISQAYRLLKVRARNWTKNFILTIDISIGIEMALPPIK